MSKYVAGDTMKETVGETKQQVLVQVVDPLAPASAMKSVNSPTIAYVKEMRGLRLSRIPEVYSCKECNSPLHVLDHFK